MSRGLLITFEGIEGSGKTTQIKNTAEHLRSLGKNVHVTRQPGGTEIGKKIRQILLDPENSNMVPKAELLLYMADRAQHIEETITPMLDSGTIVLCDRFADATYVYQGVARGLGTVLYESLHRILFADITPDLTLLIDLPPETGLKRAWNAVLTGTRRPGETRFEEESLDFHRKIRDGYLDLARRYPERFFVVDGTRDEETVKEQIIFAINRRLSG